MDFLTVREIAKKLRVSEKTIRIWAANGVLPVYRPTKRKLLFDFEQCKAAMVRKRKTA